MNVEDLDLLKKNYEFKIKCTGVNVTALLFRPLIFQLLFTCIVTRSIFSLIVRMVSLCLKANAEMVPKIPSCHCMLLM